MNSERGYARIRGVVHRHRRPVLLVVGCAAVLGELVVWLLPPTYRASAVVRAVEAQPAKDYVAPSVLEPLGERIKSLRIAAMARPILTQVAKELDLPTALRRPLEEVVEAMRSQMEVKLEGEDTFLLTYEDPDRNRAHTVLDRVANRFIQRQIEQRTALAETAVRAIANEVDRIRPLFEGSEQTLREFRQLRYGALPEQQESNLRALDQATLEVNIQATNWNYEQERRRQLLSAALSPLRHQEDLLETEFHTARTRYTPAHTEVQRIVLELDRVRTQRQHDEAQLRAQLHQSSPELAAIESEIRRTESTIAALRTRQKQVRGRVEATAANGEVLAHLNTEHEVLHHRLQTALGRLHESQLALGVERAFADQRYALIEGSSVPLRPVRPNRPLFALLALVAALVLGISVGFGLDWTGPALPTQELDAMAGR